MPLSIINSSIFLKDEAINSGHVLPVINIKQKCKLSVIYNINQNLCFNSTLILIYFERNKLYHS